MLAKLSVLGLYQFDNTIFNDLAIPDELDKDLLLDQILTESAELNTVYPEPAIFKHMIKSWSERHLANWQKLYDSTVLDYNPIENYDRQEDGVDGTTYSNSKTVTGDSTNQNTSFNSGTLETTDKNLYNDSDMDSGYHSLNHTLRVHGNIGVTTSQQMIQSERELVRFNLYDEITNDFLDVFCVRVY